MEASSKMPGPFRWFFVLQISRNFLPTPTFPHTKIQAQQLPLPSHLSLILFVWDRCVFWRLVVYSQPYPFGTVIIMMNRSFFLSTLLKAQKGLRVDTSESVQFVLLSLMSKDSILSLLQNYWAILCYIFSNMSIRRMEASWQWFSLTELQKMKGESEMERASLWFLAFKLMEQPEKTLDSPFVLQEFGGVYQLFSFLCFVTQKLIYYQEMH